MKRVLVVGPSIPSCLQENPSVVVVHQPLIDLKVLAISEESLSPLETVDSLTLTSKHAAFFFRTVLANRSLLPSIPIFCVGPSTAKCSSSLFPNPIITANTHTQEGLAHCILQHKPKDTFWPRSTLARTLLASTLRSAGVTVYELPLYMPTESHSQLNLEGIDEVFFTSPSSVIAFFSQLSCLPPIALTAIGPITARQLETVYSVYKQQQK